MRSASPGDVGGRGASRDPARARLPAGRCRRRRPRLDRVGSRRRVRARFERCTTALVDGIGTVDQSLDLPPLAPSRRRASRYFYVCVFVAAMPYVRDYHRAHGVQADVSRRTLADLGRHMTTHRLRLGTGGLLEPAWSQAALQGRGLPARSAAVPAATPGPEHGRGSRAAGLPYGPNDGCLEIHIPTRLGPLTHSVCDKSLTEARREFFDGRFPGERYRLAACKSWLLDPQLADYLPADSNIVRFQRRFRTAYAMTEAR